MHEDGTLADTPQQVKALTDQGYQKCRNQLCNFMVSPQVQEELYNDHGEEAWPYQCPHCGVKFNLNKAPGTPGGGTNSGLGLGEMAQIAEDLVEKMGTIPGYGSILWMHKGGATANSAFDGAVKGWGIEVKAANWNSQRKRGIIDPQERQRKWKAVQNPSLWAKQMLDPKLDAALHSIGHVQGLLGVLVLMDFDKATADIFARPMPHDPEHKSGGVISFSRNAAAQVASDVPFDTGLPDPRQKGFKPYHEQTQMPIADDPVFSKTALDYAGDSAPGQEPQAVEDHSSPGDDWYGESKEYKFFYAKGELHVSPDHGHDELREHIGIPSDHAGPTAVGYVTLQDRSATWDVTSNVGLTALARILKDYTKSVGWKWGGLVGSDGQPISDDFAPKKTKYLVDDDTQEGTSFVVQGKTAYVNGFDEDQREAVASQGFKLAEYPGGGNMNDMIKNHAPMGEDLEQWNMGDMNKQDDRSTQQDREPSGVFKCKDCGRLFPRWRQYLDHQREHSMLTQDPVQDGHFPELDKDATPPPYEHERQPNIFPIARVYYGMAEQTGHTAIDTVIDAFKKKDMFPQSGPDYFPMDEMKNPDTSSGRCSDVTDYFVEFAEESGLNAWSSEIQEDHNPLDAIPIHTPEVFGYGDREIPGKERYHAVAMVKDEGGATYMVDFSASQYGYKEWPMVQRMDGLAKWKRNFSAANDPKDQLSDAVPFIFDVKDDAISIGHPGARHSDIHGQFTAGGIVEGTYEPGGKVVLRSMTNMPYSTYHLIELWYHSVPHMEVKSVELQDDAGGTTKLAATPDADIGGYLAALAAADPAVHSASKALRKAGGKVYVVGGAVRDALLGKDPKDIDLMVQGIHPGSVRKLLEALPGRVDLTGKDFGVFRYKHAGHDVEIALPRRERSTGAGHQDFDVQADHTMPVEEDLKRRDFTANAMAVDLDQGELVDPFNGADDLANGKLKTVTPESFKEDPLRIVRALGAHSRHGLNPHPDTRAQMAENASGLLHLPKERIQAELDKIFKSQDPAKAIKLAHDTGVLQHIFPEIDATWDFDQNNPHHNHVLGEHALSVLENISRLTDDPDLRLGALYHDAGKPGSEWRDPITGKSHFYRGKNGEGADHEIVSSDMLRKRLQDLKYSRARTDRMCEVVRHHMYPDFSSPKGARKFLNRVGPHADDLMILREADRAGKGTDEYQETKTSVGYQRKLVGDVREAGQAVQQSNLAVSGHDLIGMGMKPGPEIGAILKRLTDAVVEDPQLNTRDQLLALARS